MVAPYGWPKAIPVLTELYVACLRGLFDLGELTTWKSSLIVRDSVQKMFISAHREIK
jgi:hypothetical protein